MKEIQEREFVGAEILALKVLHQIMAEEKFGYINPPIFDKVARVLTDCLEQYKKELDAEKSITIALGVN